ncbi:MAG TPA: SDR family oxidoreductase [Pirellulales bacterium]|jgi:NAD(P)-dependent dehydrogenase (short-subunit alcohol dehydrogenase family)|nr:SDR family oxidoreductase [Pirellulales bacterium]
MAIDSRAKPAIFITGTSTGIGAACAVELANSGYRVFAGVRQPADGAHLQGLSMGELTPVLVDVTDEPTVRAAAETIGAAVGEAGLAGLVNNAGIVVAGPLELLPTSELRRQLEVNVLGTHAVTRAVLPLVRRAHGRIVMMGSISGLIAPPYIGAYAASKYALEAMTDALRVELARWRIRVSIIEPDAVATPIWDKLDRAITALGADADPQIQQLYAAEIEQMRVAGQNLGKTGVPTSRVVHAVLHALSARWPKTRYPIGWRPWLAFGGARHVPPSLLDWILRKSMGLP